MKNSQYTLAFLSILMVGSISTMNLFSSGTSEFLSDLSPDFFAKFKYGTNLTFLSTHDTSEVLKNGIASVDVEIPESEIPEDMKSDQPTSLYQLGKF